MQIAPDDFAAAVDAAWRRSLEQRGLRDKTLTLTFADMSPRLLEASTGELLGFLGGLNTGQDLPLFLSSKYGFVAHDVANCRVTFRGATFVVSDGAVGMRYGTTFAIKSYPPKTACTMFDDLNLPVDMVVTHSFTPINSNIMASSESAPSSAARISRRWRQAVEPFPHVRDPDGNPDPRVRWDRDHTASSARTRLAIAVGSSLSVTTSRCPLRVVISILVTTGGTRWPSPIASTTSTGNRTAGSGAGRNRSSLHHVGIQRATPATVAPSTIVSATT